MSKLASINRRPSNQKAAEKEKARISPQAITIVGRFRQYNSLEELEVKLNKIGEEEYSRYLFSAEQFLNSNEFQNTFSIEKYVESILQGIEVKK